MPRLIAEWMPQGAVLLAWPTAQTDWAANLEAVVRTYARIGAAISRRQPLLLACPSEAEVLAARAALEHAGADTSRLRTFIADYNDTWARDFGPLSLAGDTETLVDFRFNGWGGKFESAADDRLSRQLHEQGAFAVPLRRRDEVLEGGSIDTDGEGSLLTTPSCLLDPRRNPRLDQVAIERMLATELGCERIIWLAEGWLAGDDTDGHVDNLARFTDPGTIVHAACDDPEDPHFGPLRRLADELAQLRRRNGRAYRIVPLPLPRAITGLTGHRLPASYVNFLIINTAVLVPTFDDPADAIAVERLARCFPSREIVTLDARALLEQGGGIHCISMQLARGVVSP